MTRYKVASWQNITNQRNSMTEKKEAKRCTGINELRYISKQMSITNLESYLWVSYPLEFTSLFITITPYIPIIVIHFFSTAYHPMKSAIKIHSFKLKFYFALIIELIFPGKVSCIFLNSMYKVQSSLWNQSTFLDKYYWLCKLSKYWFCSFIEGSVTMPF